MIYKILLIITVYAGNLNGGVSTITYEPKFIYFSQQECVEAMKQFPVSLKKEGISESQRVDIVGICYGGKSSTFRP